TTLLRQIENQLIKLKPDYDWWQWQPNHSRHYGSANMDTSASPRSSSAPFSNNLLQSKSSASSAIESEQPNFEPIEFKRRQAPLQRAICFFLHAFPHHPRNESLNSSNSHNSTTTSTTTATATNMDLSELSSSS